MDSSLERRVSDLPAAPGVGFATCPTERRIIKVWMANYRARRLAVACPHCRSVHLTPDPQGRPLREGETFDLVEHAETPTAPAAPAKPTKPPASQRVSDAAIFAALSRHEDRRADEVAKALSYSEPGALVSRVKRINARTPDAPPIILGRAAVPGRPITLRLA